MKKQRSARCPGFPRVTKIPWRLCFFFPCTVKTLDRDSFMSPMEAKEWGLIDEILVERSAAEVHM